MRILKQKGAIRQKRFLSFKNSLIITNFIKRLAGLESDAFQT